MRNEAMRSRREWPAYIHLFRHSRRAGQALATSVGLLADLVPMELSLSS